MSIFFGVFSKVPHFAQPAEIEKSLENSSAYSSGTFSSVFYLTNAIRYNFLKSFVFFKVRRASTEEDCEAGRDCRWARSKTLTSEEVGIIKEEWHKTLRRI